MHVMDKFLLNLSSKALDLSLALDFLNEKTRRWYDIFFINKQNGRGLNDPMPLM